MIIDKQPGWTSHDVVNKARRIVGERSIGHLGTLDPLATGVLPLLIGTATRLAKFYGHADKVYEARVRFGFATDTYDSEGERTTEEVPVHLDREELERALVRFRGVTEQTPPQFSAKKIAGVPAYKMARKKETVVLAPVQIEIFSLELLEILQNEAILRVHCGSGTYVRSLAHDLGCALGVGAHLTALRRTRSGDFDIGQAFTLDRLEQMKMDGDLASAILPAAELLPSFPAVIADDSTAADIRMGRNFRTSPFRLPPGALLIKAVTETGALLAIAEAVLPHVYHPIVVFPQT